MSSRAKVLALFISHPGVAISIMSWARPTAWLRLLRLMMKRNSIPRSATSPALMPPNDPLRKKSLPCFAKKECSLLSKNTHIFTRIAGAQALNSFSDPWTNGSSACHGGKKSWIWCRRLTSSLNPSMAEPESWIGSRTWAIG